MCIQIDVNWVKFSLKFLKQKELNQFILILYEKKNIVNLKCILISGSESEIYRTVMVSKHRKSDVINFLT